VNTPLLFDKPECPFCWKVRLALALKGITVERHSVDTRNKPPEFLALSPKGTVPVLVIDNRVIDESSQIISWADSLYPGVPPLRDPKSADLEQLSDKVIGSGIRDHIFMRRDEPKHQWDAATTRRCQCAWDQILDTLEIACHPDGPWFLGLNASVADCALGARIALANHYGLTGLATRVKLQAWYTRLQTTAQWRIAAAPIGLN